MFSLVVQSLVTVAPGGETMQCALMGIAAGLAVVFAVVALTFVWLGVSGPKWLVRTFVGAALLATVMVMLISVG